MATLPTVVPVSEQDNDFNTEGAYIGPVDAIDDILGDIIDGRSARSKIDALKRSGGQPVQFRPRVDRPRAGAVKQRSSIDDAVLELVAESKAEHLPARTGVVSPAEADAVADRMLDRAVGRFLGEDEPDQDGEPRRHRQRPGAGLKASDMAAVAHRERKMAEAETAGQIATVVVADYCRYVQNVAAEFPGIQREADLVHLSRVDPQAYLIFKERERELARIATNVAHLAIHADAAKQAAFDAAAPIEDALFMRRNPGWSEQDAAEMIAMLQGAGISIMELQKLWATTAPVNLGDPRALKIIEDAICHHLGGRPQNRAAFIPAVVDMFNAAGFTDDEIGVLTRGVAVSLRDHRIQQIVAWALAWRRAGRE